MTDHKPTPRQTLPEFVRDLDLVDAFDELLHRYRSIEAEHDTLVNAACAYIDRTANNSARDSTRERAALIALLPELGPMVWSDELQHYVRLPVEEVSRG